MQILNSTRIFNVFSFLVFLDYLPSVEWKIISKISSKIELE